jgi:hypothetical protein
MDPNNPTPPPTPPAAYPPQAPPPGMMYAPPPKKDNGLKVALIVIGAVVGGIALIIIVLVVLLAVAFSHTQQQAQDATRFVTDVQNNSVSDAYSLTTPSYQQANSQSQFATLIANDHQALPKTTPQVENRDINDTNGTSTATITVNIPADASQTTSQHATIHFTEENNKWLIDNFNFAHGLASAN